MYDIGTAGDFLHISLSTHRTILSERVLCDFDGLNCSAAVSPRLKGTQGLAVRRYEIEAVVVRRYHVAILSHSAVLIERHCLYLDGKDCLAFVIEDFEVLGRNSYQILLLNFG